MTESGNACKPTNGPFMSQASLEPSSAVTCVDEFGEIRDGFVAVERPLTLYLNKREIVTLMTMGTEPELLVLGWIRNQRLVSCLSKIRSIQVEWDVESAAITTYDEVEMLERKLAKRTITTGCGQGTVYGDALSDLEKIRLPRATLSQSTLYGLLNSVNHYNDIYKRAGAVHGCALCEGTDIVKFVEDVGRHNAVDALAGHMWINGIKGENKIFYTTGRLTSEMVLKVAQMGVPVLLSRSGITKMGLELAEKVGVILIARAKGRHFLIYHGADQIELDAVPPKVVSDRSGSHRRKST